MYLFSGEIYWCRREIYCQTAAKTFQRVFISVKIQSTSYIWKRYKYICVSEKYICIIDKYICVMDEYIGVEEKYIARPQPKLFKKSSYLLRFI